MWTTYKIAKFEELIVSDVLGSGFYFGDVFGSVFYFGDVLGSVFNNGDVFGSVSFIGDLYGLHKNRLLSLKH